MKTSVPPTTAPVPLRKVILDELARGRLANRAQPLPPVPPVLLAGDFPEPGLWFKPSVEGIRIPADQATMADLPIPLPAAPAAPMTWASLPTLIPPWIEELQSLPARLFLPCSARALAQAGSVCVLVASWMADDAALLTFATRSTGRQLATASVRRRTRRSVAQSSAAAHRSRTPVHSGDLPRSELCRRNRFSHRRRGLARTRRLRPRDNAAGWSGRGLGGSRGPFCPAAPASAVAPILCPTPRES